jgi:hypothetical protein
MSTFKFNNSLMNSHLISIPSLGTFTTRSLSGSDPHSSSGPRSWALDLDGQRALSIVVQLSSSTGDFGTSFVDRFRVGSRDGDSDVALGFGFGNFVVFGVVGHF